MKPKIALLTGQPQYEHVGSKAVRKVIEEFQPKLGLHGAFLSLGPAPYLGRVTLRD